MPVAEQRGGDTERRMDERDLDVAVTVGSPLDERQGGQDPFGVCEVLARRRAWVLGVRGPDSVSDQGPWAWACWPAQGPPGYFVRSGNRLCASWWWITAARTTTTGVTTTTGTIHH